MLWALRYIDLVPALPGITYCQLLVHIAARVVVCHVTVQVGWSGGAVPLPASLLVDSLWRLCRHNESTRRFCGGLRPHMHQVKPPGGGLGASGPKEYLCRARFCQQSWQNLARQSEFLGLPP